MAEVAFQQVLAGANFQVIKLPHPWLSVLAQNMDGHAALLIRATLTPEQIVGDGRGFAVKTERNGCDDYVRISSVRPGLPPVFLKLVEYVLDRTSSAVSNDEAVRTLVESVDEFRLFSARRGGRLSEEEVRGLFAELTLLRLLIHSGEDAAAVMAAWKGALARDGIGLHDFTFADGRGIEVKSTHQPPLEIRVSSPTQLVPTRLPLDLVVLPLEEVPPGSKAGFPFRSFVSETSALLSSAGPVPRKGWDKAIDALGIDLEDEYYDQWQFLPGTWIRFAVRNGFPSIATDGLPDGVVKVTYSLDLQHLWPFAEPFSDLLSLGVR